MGSVAAVIIAGIAVYAAAGVVTGLAFVLFGVSRVPPEPASVTVGARVLFLPGAAILWPIVLGRWLNAGRGR
jgi:hypothetical protein